MTRNLTPGDEWTEHYRGYRLHVNPQGDVWWQVYNGTDRLYIDSFPEEIIDRLLEQKPLGGRIHITEAGDVLTKLEDESEQDHPGERDYTGIWIGTVNLTGNLTPKEAPELAFPIHPDTHSPGDLWASVYDGARYSFNTKGRVWWRNTSTRKHHPVTTELPESIWRQFRLHKPEAGSFRVTPSGAVITLVRAPGTQLVRDQFGDLPDVVRNIIQLRRERANLAMLPVYLGTLENPEFEVKDPKSLTDPLLDDELKELEDWAASLGSTNRTQASHHTETPSSTATPDTKSSPEETEKTPAAHEDEQSDDEPPEFDDDPVAWMQKDLEKTGDRINDRFD